MTRSGLLVVRDALTVGPWTETRRSPRQRRPPGDIQADHVLLRTIKCLQGFVEVTVDCEPMFDYGRVAARWRHDGDGYHRATAAAPDGRPESPARHQPPARLRRRPRVGTDDAARVGACVRRAFVGRRRAAGDGRRRIRPHGANVRALAPLGLERPFSRSSVADTPSPQRADAEGPDLLADGRDGGRRDDVATAGAARARNWDLRYSFVRDSAWALRALYALGFGWEADDFLAFLADVSQDERPLQNLYRLNGDDPPDETELHHLAGYGGARPVRVGNAAVSYSQHDVQRRPRRRGRGSGARPTATAEHGLGDRPPPGRGCDRAVSRAGPGHMVAIARNRATTRHRRSCAGSRPTAALRSPTCVDAPTRRVHVARDRGRDRRRRARHGVSRARRSSETTTRTSSMRRCSSFRSSASCRATTIACPAHHARDRRRVDGGRGRPRGAARRPGTSPRARRSRSAHGGSSPRSSPSARSTARTRLRSVSLASEAGSASTPSTSTRLLGRQFGNVPARTDPPRADRRAPARDQCRAMTNGRPRQHQRRSGSTSRPMRSAFRSTRSTPTARVPM